MTANRKGNPMLAAMAGLSDGQKAQLMAMAEAIRTGKATEVATLASPRNAFEAIMAEPDAPKAATGWTGKAAIKLREYGEPEGSIVFAYRTKRFGVMSYKGANAETVRRYRATGALAYMLAVGVWNGRDVVTEGFDQYPSRDALLAALNRKLTDKDGDSAKLAS